MTQAAHGPSGRLLLNQRVSARPPQKFSDISLGWLSSFGNGEMISITERKEPGKRGIGLGTIGMNMHWTQETRDASLPSVSSQDASQMIPGRGCQADDAF